VRLVAIVLAAGAGTRFGGDKLSASFRGEPLLCHAVRAACAAPVQRVLVVCSPALDTACADVAGVPVEIVRVDSNALSTSLVAGLAAAGEVDGAFVFLGDMPLVPHTIARRLLEDLGDNFAAVPRYRGQVGHPVLLSSMAVSAVMTLQGDQGAGRLLRGRTDVAYLDVDDEGVVLDVDRAEDLAQLEQRVNAGR